MQISNTLEGLFPLKASADGDFKRGEVGGEGGGEERGNFNRKLTSAYEQGRMYRL